MAHILDKFLRDPNKKILKGYQKTVDVINALEDSFASLTDEQLKAKTAEFQEKVKTGSTLEDILPEAFATVREAAKRVKGQRHYDVQLMGGMALNGHNIAEMRTGEGKTLTSTLPVYLNALSGKGAHVVTVNDYLAKRDAVWMGEIYQFLGLTIGCIQHESGYLYDPTATVTESEDESEEAGYKIDHESLRPVSRKEAYDADITYGTNNEFGFDYLRDNMVQDAAQRVQRELNFAIIDEVDSILIDEARTPLIISAPAQASSDMYKTFATLVKRLKEDEDYNVDEKMKAATLTEEGISKMEGWLNVDNIYVEGGVHMVHHIEQALRAEVLYHNDKEYVVRDGEIVIVDEFTGRMMEGRRFSEGLHQAIEAKEGVTIKEESQTLGTITFQNYFRMYDKLAGMTGTAKTEEEEFQKIYDMSVVVIPTNKPIVREDQNDQIFKSYDAKINAIVEEVRAAQEKGQPVLIGTISIQKNEMMSQALTKAGIKHELLNAKNHEREGEIVAQAGRRGAVTVATNMAGRGVDIALGGAPLKQETYEEVKGLGGLYVIGSERHDARRIDNQLRGRAGRQGDPGRTRFFISLDDELMRFAPDRMRSVMNMLPDEVPIENRLVSRSIESAQSRIEGNNFDIRKRLLDYDNVLNKQREAVYDIRREIVMKDLNEDSGAMKPMVLEYVHGEIEDVVHFHTPEGQDWNVTEIFETMKTIVEVPAALKDEFMKFNAAQAPSKPEEASATRQALVEALTEQATKVYEELEGAFPDRMHYARVERQLLTRSIDALWVEHLNAMRKLRSSSGLHGYAQRDPLIEYKREGYQMFQSMLTEIQKQVAYSVFKVGEALKLATQGASLADRVGLSTPAQVAKNADTEIGRNDPCHCGAVKEDGTPVKYKKCHGRNA